MSVALAAYFRMTCMSGQFRQTVMVNGVLWQSVLDRKAGTIRVTKKINAYGTKRAKIYYRDYRVDQFLSFGL